MSYELQIILRSEGNPVLAWASKDGGPEADRVFDLGVELMKAWMALRKANQPSLPDPPDLQSMKPEPGDTKDG